MFEKFTDRCRLVMRLARQEAQRRNSEFIGTEHILIGIVAEGGGRAAAILKDLNVTLNRVQKEIEKLINPSYSPTVMLGQLPFSPRAKRVIELAGEAASGDAIDIEHLLLALLKESEGIAAQVLMNLGLRLDDIRGMIVERSSTPPPEPIYRPSVGETLAQLLLKGRAVALVGPAGVGKTSLVRALCEAHPSLKPVAVVRPIFRGRFDGDEIARAMDGRRLVLEFRPDEFETYARGFPEAFEPLLPLKVDPPDDDESWQLLNAARTQLLEATGLAPTDATLREAHAMAKRMIREPLPPWSTMHAMWAAAPHERALRVPKDLDERIAWFNALKDEAVARQHFERAAVYRDKRKAVERERAAIIDASSANRELSIAALRAAIEVDSIRASS